jgi:hypothetical protein
MKSLIEGVTNYQDLVQNFSPFTGFFPPIIDGAIMEIVLSTIPGHPKRESVSKGQLAERFMALAELERLKIDTGNGPVENIVQDAVSAGKPIALYLRNFMFGVSLHEGRDDPYDIPQVLSASSTSDANLQSLLMERATNVTWIKISNPAADTVGFENSLILGNDQWQEPVTLLAHHAAVIIMYYFTLTPGVSIEMNLLKNAGAQEKTLIVISGDDPRKNEMAITIRQLFGSEKDAVAAVSEREQQANSTIAVEEKELLSAFPHKIIQPANEQGWKEFQLMLNDILDKATVMLGNELIKFPPRPKPVWEALLLAKDQALMAFELGKAFYEKEMGEEAEHAFIRCIAFSHWARDPMGRALGFLFLARVERFFLKYPNEAVQCYETTLDIFETLLPGSQIASQYFEPVANDLIKYLRELKDEPGAASVAFQLKRVKEQLKTK